MSAPRPLPIRVLVKGASLMHDMSERPQHREDFTFGRVIEESLLASGYGADVWIAAVASETMKRAFREWEPQVKAWSPDVVILSYGYYECVHLILPRWLERHANSLKNRPGGYRTLYRKYLLRPVWRTLAQLQRALDTRIGPRGFGRVVRQTEVELREFIDRTRIVGEPLVMLFEFLVPGARGQSWFPGMAARAEMMNVMLRRVVADYADPEIVLVPVPDIVARSIPADVEPNADGFHYNAAVHQVLGEQLAEDIRTWAARHPRLTPDGGAAARLSGAQQPE